MPDSAKKILIIEDETFIADIYARELTKAGFEVQIESTGPAGLQALEKNTFDLLLLDIMLPGMHGLELLREWRIKHPNSPMPVLLLTNLGQDEVIKEAFTLGAQGYLIKASYTPQQVVTEVQNTLQAKPVAPAPSST